MGFFDKLKQKAQETLGTSEVEAPPNAGASDAGVAPAAESGGPTFTWDDFTFPVPAGWDGLPVEDWFAKLEALRARIFRADEVPDLPEITDEDGDPLDPEEILLRREGFESGHHFECFRSWGIHGWAAKMGEDPTNLEFRMSGAANEQVMAAQAQAAQVPGGLLEPVEGVSCEQWAQLNAQVAQGGDLDQLIAQVGMDRAKWDRVSGEWNARMSSDTSMTVTSIYGAAFTAGAGQFAGHAATAAQEGVLGDLGSEPMPFEKMIEIECAVAAASERGEDVMQVFTQFGINAADFGAIGMYWSKKIQQDAMGYHQKRTELEAHYRAMYQR